MRIYLKAGLALVFFLFILSETAFAFGTNITINDNRDRAVPGLGIGQEDQETEPGMIQNQSWDLEAFYLEGSTLTMVGGFNFVSGVSGYSRYQSGDIFIDVNGDAEFGVGADDSVLNYGYDYVVDLNLNGAGNSSLGYSIYALDANSALIDVLEAYNDPESNPWRYDAAGSNAVAEADGTVTFLEGLTDDEAGGFNGGTHYAVTGIDLSSILGVNQDLILHFTMGCGNDNLMGQYSGAPVPEPATMLLLGAGMVGLAGFGRKKLK